MRHGRVVYEAGLLLPIYLPKRCDARCRAIDIHSIERIGVRLERRRRPGIVTAVIGCILILAAPAWRFGIGPLFIRLPGDLKNVSTRTGKMTVYADRTTSRFYPAGREVVTGLTIDNEDIGDPSMSDPGALVVKERVTMRDSSTGQVLEGMRPPTIYILDRRTCENIPGRIDGIDRIGFTIKLPMLAEKKNYQVWDDDLDGTVVARFVKTGRVDGDRVKSVGVYVYRIASDIDRMAKPPPGVPESITGKAAKELTGNPRLPVADTAEIEIEYFKKTDAIMYVEPKMGTVLATPSYRYTYYVKNAPGQSPKYVKIAEVELSTDPASVRHDVDASRKYTRLIDLDLRWTPLSFLASGLALLALGFFIR